MPTDIYSWYFISVVGNVLLSLVTGESSANRSQQDVVGEIFHDIPRNKSFNVLVSVFSGPNVVYRHEIKPPGHLVVKTKADLARIISMDELSQVMTASFWVTLQWEDPNLTWNITDEDFKDVFAVRIPQRYAWTPDLTLWNNVDDEFRNLLPEMIVTVTHEGHVTWTYPAMFRTVCPLNVYKYPFDSHKCDFIFGSWTFHEGLVELVPHGDTPADISHYVPHNVWTLLNFDVTKTTASYHEGADGQHEDFSIMIFSIEYQRRWILPFVYLVVPNLLINLMVAISFLLPCESFEKVGVSVSVFLALIIYLLLFYRLLPFTNTVPLLIRYVISTVFITALSVVLNIIILSLHNAGGKDNRTRIPEWAKRVLLKKLGPWIGLGAPPDEKADKVNQINKTIDIFEVIPDEESSTKPLIRRSSRRFTYTDAFGPDSNENKNSNVRNRNRNNADEEDGQPQRKSLWLPRQSVGAEGSAGSGPRRSRVRKSISVMKRSEIKNNHEILLYKILKHCEDIKADLVVEQNASEVVLEWKQLGFIFDRIMFFIYLLETVILWWYLYLQIPDLEEGL